MLKFNHKVINPACPKRLINIQSITDTKDLTQIEAMILTCPSCSASYMVPADAIGDAGRDVRCKKCSHVWHQLSEKDSLNQLIDTIQSKKIDDDISFDGQESPQESDPENRAGGVHKAWSLKLSGAAVACAVFSMLLFGLVEQRNLICNMFPQLAHIYAKIGFPSPGQATTNPETALTLDHVTFNDQDGHATLSGNLINLTSKAVTLPNIKVTYLDGTGQKLGDTTHSPPVATLAKESSTEISLPVDATIAPKAAVADIRFSQ
jgi:predicted Zn finger-like uncharacterized protein